MDRSHYVRLVAILALASLCFATACQREPQPIAQTETPEERAAAAVEVYSNPAPTEEDGDELNESIQQFFDEARVGLTSGDGDQFGRYFHSRLALEAMERQELLPNGIASDDPLFLETLNTAMAKRLADPNNGITWNRIEIRNVKFLDSNNEALVYVRQWDENDVAQKVRWWLVRQRDRWRAHDFEILEVSMRFTTMLGLGFKMADRGDPTMRRMPELLGAVQQGVAGDVEPAIETLRDLEGIDFPPVIEALRLLTLSGFLCDQWEFEESLELANRALKINPDLPVIHLVTGHSRNGLSQHDQALEEAERYASLLGTDGDYYVVVGDAHAGLGEKKEAVAAYRKGLADDAQTGLNVLGLLQTLPAEERGSVEQHYQALNNVEGWFITFADTALYADDGELLRTVIELHRGIMPEDENIAYYAEALTEF